MASENGEKAAPEDIPEPSDLEKKIIKQVEYYFGDVNLARDRFMQAQIKEDDGWISMETMLKFNRLASLSSDAGEIIKALRKSSSGLMEISDDEQKIRRNPEKPLPPNTQERRDDIKSRSAYIKGFPLTATINDLLEFFEKHGAPENVQMRRDAERAFKGSVYAIFKTSDDLNKFLQAEEIKYEDTPLIRMLKDDYFQKKANEKKAAKEETVQRLEEEKQKIDEENEKKFLEKITKGAILHVTGLKEGIARDNIKSFFQDHNVAWVDHDKGDTEAWVRFEAENGAKAAWEACKEKGDGKVVIEGSEVEGVILEGELELHHWRNIFQSQADKKNYRKRKFGRPGQGRGGRGFKKGGQRYWKVQVDDDDGAGSDGEPETKKAKSED